MPVSDFGTELPDCSHSALCGPVLSYAEHQSVPATAWNVPAAEVRAARLLRPEVVGHEVAAAAAAAAAAAGVDAAQEVLAVLVWVQCHELVAVEWTAATSVL